MVEPQLTQIAILCYLRQGFLRYSHHQAARIY